MWQHRSSKPFLGSAPLTSKAQLRLWQALPEPLVQAGTGCACDDPARDGVVIEARTHACTRACMSPQRLWILPAAVVSEQHLVFECLTTPLEDLGACDVRCDDKDVG
jgi:hypothetical protein